MPPRPHAGDPTSVAPRALAPITTQLLPRDWPHAQLARFVLEQGDTPYNWVPEGPVRAHFAGLPSGDTLVWGAFAGDDLVGLITARRGGQYSRRPAEREGVEPRAEIGEFVVADSARGQGVGGALARAAVRGVFRALPGADTLYVMLHADNLPSERAFLAAGFTRALTYADPARGRHTTVLQVGRPMRVLGLQSGNAVDGIDVCVIDVPAPPRRAADSRHVTHLDFDVVAFGVVPWEAEARERVLRLRDGDADPTACAEGDYAIGEQLAGAAAQVLAEAGVPTASVDLVSSHGQSIRGHPHWEFGELAVLSERLGATAVGDFRPADVAAGGNGSPCTATYDALVLRPERGERICINIGGTTSVTFCPAKGDERPVLGLDPGIGVFYMDLHAAIALPGARYDAGGALAAQGRVHEGLLAEWLQHPHFQRDTLPISIGAEDFPRSLFATWHARAQALGCSPADVQATLSELTARSIALACQRFGPRTDDVLVRGGVRHNADFMARLRRNLSDALGLPIARLRGLDDLGIDEDAWETAMYALFGYLCVHGLHAFQPSCTGAARPVIAGKICPGPDFEGVALRPRGARS